MDFHNSFKRNRKKQDMYGHIYSKSMDQPVRLPILLVVSRIWKIYGSLLAFAPENLVSRDGFGSPVPSRASLLISILRLNLVLKYVIPPELRGGVHLFI